MNYWRKWRYKYLTFFFISFIFALYLAENEDFHLFLLNLGNWGYIGALFAGILFVSTLTIAAGAVILVILAERLSPIELALIAGLGGMIGDFVIFRFVKDGLLSEITPIYNKLGGKYITELLRRKYFNWLLPVIGAIIIVSPFPDEIGVSLMGITKIKSYQFLLLSFVLDVIGVFLFIVSARAIIS
jgi:hypothetical protein